MVRFFPFQSRSNPSLLRSWRKEERRQGGEVRLWLRRTSLLALTLIVPLMALQLQRRVIRLEEELQEAREDNVALMESNLAMTNRIARDWGYWDDAYRFMQGLNPAYPANNLSHAALFDDGGVMVLLDPQGRHRLSFNQPQRTLANHSGLVRCLQGNLHRLPETRSTARIACRDDDGSLYLGTATSVSDNVGRAPRAGFIAMFDPLLHPTYPQRTRKRLLELSGHLNLVPATEAGTTALIPLIHGEGSRVLALRPIDRMGLLIRGLLEELPLLVALAALATVLRAMQMLERRGQHLRNRLVQRQANHRIRRVCHTLDDLVADLDQRGTLPGDPPPVSTLLNEAPESQAPATERRLNRVARRFHQVLVHTRSLALQDPLTELPNRRCFLEELEARAHRARAENRPLAILFVDIDRFKAINDAYGHAVGDGVLVVVAQRLREVLRPTDCLARYGGDELALILDPSDDHDPSAEAVARHASRVTRRLAEAVRDPLQVGNHSLRITLSIGHSLLDPGEEEIDAVLRRSDQAMYAKKRQAQNNPPTV